MADKREWATKWLETEKRNYIGKEWSRGRNERVWESINPANQQTLCSYSMASKEDVNAAVQSASGAFKSGSWSKLPKKQRMNSLNKMAELIRSNIEELATLEVLSSGKLFTEAMGELPEAADVFEYYAGWIDKHYGENCPVEEGFISYTVKEPVGVCALIVPWNFPLLLACWKMSAALSMGNTVVIKSSEHTPYSLIRFVELIHEKIDLAPGVLNLVLGDGEVGQYLSGHMDVNKISFTGSTAVGRKILQNSAESNLKTITLELGGKSPNILFDDVPDLEAAILRSYEAMFSNKGEKCSEPTRIFIHDKIYDKVVAQLASMAKDIRCGDPFSEQSDQGPQCNKEQYEKILKYIEFGKEEGARLVEGGTPDTTGDNAKGFYIRPTIFADANNQMKVAQEEIFGPVLVAIRFKDEDEVIKMANDTTYGLAAGLWSADVSRAHRVASKLDAGMVYINRYGCYDFSAPFGGFKQSGWGKEMAKQSLEAYTRTKTVWLKI